MGDLHCFRAVGFAGASGCVGLVARFGAMFAGMGIMSLGCPELMVGVMPCEFRKLNALVRAADIWGWKSATAFGPKL